MHHPHPTCRLVERHSLHPRQAKRIPARKLLVLVGIILTATSAYGVYSALTS